MPEAVVNSSPTPEVTPLALLPVYLALIATSRRSCVSIPSSQTQVVEACAKLSDSVKKFREYLEPFATILPTNEQMKDIPSPFNPFAAWDLSSSSQNSTSHTDLKTLVNDFLAMNHDIGKEMPGDEHKSSFFSRQKIAILTSQAASSENLDLGKNFQTEILFASLSQIRLIRVDLGDLEKKLLGLLLASLVPSVLLFIFVLGQYLCLRKRERNTRKQLAKSARERELLDRLIEMREGREQRRQDLPLH
jgi:hypothetical protein